MAHQHGTRCYWDLESCGWVCQPDLDPEPPVIELSDEVAESVPEPAGR